MFELEILIQDLRQARVDMLNGTLKVGTVPNVIGIRYISSALWYLESPDFKGYLRYALHDLKHESVPDEFEIRLREICANLQMWS